VVLSACIAAGCGPVANNEPASGRLESQPAAASRSDVQLAAVDRAGFDAVVGGHRGQVVLVDFWATWCGPCVEQLPHVIELAEKLGQRGLAVVTLSLDDPEESQRVTEFLRSKGAGGVTNLLSRFGASPRSMAAFDIAGGAVPYYQLYDRGGRLRQTFGIDPRVRNRDTPGAIDAAIEKLLAE
jgi:thiol-disulfide isomerase/thioredoxin